MITHSFIVTVYVNEHASYAVNAEQIKIAIEDAISTPDNKHFGIERIEIVERRK